MIVRIVPIIVFWTCIAQAEIKEVSVGLASNFSEVSSSSSNPFGGYFMDGVNLALKDASTKLGKKGLRIKTKNFDYGVSNTRVLEAAKAAVASDVVAVLGYNFSSHALLAAPIHKNAGLLMLTPSATANRIGSLGSFVHQGCFDNAFMGEALAHVAKRKLKATKAAVVAAADCAYCTDLAEAFEKEFKKSGGSVSISVPVLQDDKNFDAVYEKLKNHSFDVILVPNQGLLSGRIVAALTDKGLKKPFLGGDGWGNTGREFAGVLESSHFEAYSVSHWHPQEKSKRSKDFVSAYMKEYSKEPNDTAVLAYDSMLLLIEAIINTKELTRAGVEKSLAEIRNFSGVTGNFIFQKDRAPQKSLILLSPKKSQFSVLERIEPGQGVIR